MDSSFLKEQAARCRSLADKADQFTKRRLLDLAGKYDRRMGEPSRASALSSCRLVCRRTLRVQSTSEGPGGEGETAWQKCSSPWLNFSG